MKHLKKAASALLALAMVLSLAACSSGGASATPTPSAAPAPVTAPSAAPAATPAADSHYPLTITTYNYAKEQVQYTFEKAPERVYAQAQDNIEILLALGLGDKIVGASGLDGEIRPDLAEEFAKINYYDSMPSKEELLGLEPDFITGWYSTFSDKRLGDVDFWQERGIGTYMALNSACRGPSSENPQTIEEECQDILTLGAIFNVEDRAQAIVDEIHAELDKIKAYVADRDKLSVAVLEDEGGTYRVYGEDVLGGNVAMQAGAELAVGKHGDNGNIGAEDLIAANPDAIFMVWYDGYTVGDVDYAGEQVTKLITENPAFASLDAVKNGRVYAINLSGIYCSGMRTLDGVLDFAKNLYPELYQ
ncbi:iron ABC transporter substrate-binding protein [Oscillospiraceae bacterium]|nr:iron ABC transporter substrate-binding protein [Oscillospiraceae bacterium]BDF74568.1 iron ABC transporter substrate-binding protein [Oscillospiraceae bacterium]